MGNVGKSHAEWVAWLKQPLVAVLLVLFVANFCYHMRSGLQEVVEDYVHALGSKLTATLVIKFACILIASISIFSVLRITFGG